MGLPHRATHHPPACPAWGEVELPQRSSRPERPSVLRVRADCRGRHFTAKLPVVMHYPSHQLLDHLLADDAILLAPVLRLSSRPRRSLHLLRAIWLALPRGGGRSSLGLG
jgi:hypothetical protein